jgi:hypothetical protein
MRSERTYSSREAIRASERIDWPSIIGQSLPLVTALLLWIIALQNVNLTSMGDLGLVTVLPASFYAALTVLTVSFAIQAYRQQNLALIFLHIVGLILVIHGTPQILYGTIRYSWAWKHIGIIDYIQRNGSVDPTISYLNVYQNWPGFFSFGALINELAGVDSARVYAGWAPVFFNVLDLGPLVLIFRSFTRDRRLIFTGVWFFYIGNWIGQDYFSPQAMAYFLYLVILAIVLRWLRLTRLPTREQIKRWTKFDRLAAVIHKFLLRTVASGTPDLTISRGQRAGLTAILILIFLVITTSHQLTPFMAISALVALALFLVFKGWRLALLFIVLTVTWIVYMATAYLSGNLSMIVHTIGSLLGNLSGNLVNLHSSSQAQVLIAFMDRGLTAFMIGLALLGILTRLRHDTWDVPAALLMVSPLPMLAANAYGGEILFRVYLFSLPFLAFFAAALFYPKISSGHSFSAAIVIYISLIMLAGFVFAYYGKENMNYFPPQEVEASDYLHQIAPPGSLIMDGTTNWPFLYKNYEEYSYLTISNFDKKGQQKLLNDPLDSISTIMSDYPSAYFVLNRSQFAEENLTYVLPPGTLEHIQALLMSSPRFKVIYQNQDAVIFSLNPDWKGVK